MANGILSLERQKQSAIVLANASEIVAGVIKEIAGNDISNSLGGSKLTSEVIQTLTLQAIDKSLGQQLKAG